MASKNLLDGLKAATDTAQKRPRPKRKSPPKQPVVPKRPVTSSIRYNAHDTEILQELMAWLAAQGRRATYAQIVRAALRAVGPGDALLRGFDEGVSEDRRYKDSGA